MIGGHAIAAGQRNFESTSQRGTMYGGHERFGQRSEAVQQPLSAARQLLAIGCGCHVLEFIDVGPGNPAVGLPTHQHRPDNGRVLFDTGEEALEYRTHSGIQRVDRRIGLIIAYDGHAIQHGQRDPCGRIVHHAHGLRRCGHTRSTIMACPMPPAAHTVSIPN